MKAVIRFGATQRVRKDVVNEIKLKYDLELSNGAYWAKQAVGANASEEEAILRLWEEDESYFYVPRHYTIPLLDGYEPLYVDARPVWKEYGFPCPAEPRDAIQAAAISSLLADSDDKVLCLSCGRGKSYAAIKAACSGNRLPALVIVHTEALMDQWKAQIQLFTGLKESDIGHVQGPRCDYEGKPFSMAMLHSISMRKYPAEMYGNYRTVVFDESHKLGASLFSKACHLFPGERWALSATPKRSDGNEAVLWHHMSGICYSNLEQDLQPLVWFIHTGIDTQLGRFYGRNGQINLPRLTNWTCKHEERNALILRYIERAAGQGRTILVLGERIQQLYDLHEACQVDSKSVHVGEMGQEERRDALRAQVVFASQQLAKEGLDRPAFDTLFILVPFGGEGRLQQSVGRILRIHGAKKDPYVLIFVDAHGVSTALARKMRRWFDGQDFQVKDIHPKVL